MQRSQHAFFFLFIVLEGRKVGQVQGEPGTYWFFCAVKGDSFRQARERLSQEIYKHGGFLENIAFSIFLGKQSVQCSTNILWTNFRPRNAFELFAVILHVLISLCYQSHGNISDSWMNDVFKQKEGFGHVTFGSELFMNADIWKCFTSVFPGYLLLKKSLYEWKFVKNSNTETVQFYRSQGSWLISQSSKLWFRAVQSRSVSWAQSECMPIFKGCDCHKSVTEDHEGGLQSGGAWGLPALHMVYFYKKLEHLVAVVFLPLLHSIMSAALSGHRGVNSPLSGCRK